MTKRPLLPKRITSALKRLNSNLSRWIFERFTFGQALDIFATIWFTRGVCAGLLMVRG